MAHGYYDYGVSRSVPTVHASPDIAEGAVRLGAISSVDRRGNVIGYDDFEPSTFKWITASVPGGYESSRSADYANSGSFSLKMPVPPGADNWTHAARTFGAQVMGKIGVEFKFTWEDIYTYLELYYEVATGVEDYTARVRYNFIGYVLEYFDSAGAWQPLATDVHILLEAGFFHPIKLVVDSVTGYYVRLIFDGIEYDMSQYQMQRFAPETRRYIATLIVFYNIGAAARTRYVDDVIVTQNEP